MPKSPKYPTREFAANNQLPYYVEVVPAVIRDESGKVIEDIGTSVSVRTVDTSSPVIGSVIERGIYHFNRTYEREVNKEIEEAVRHIGQTAVF